MELKCFNCSRGLMIPANVDLEGTVREETVPVRVKAMTCSRCGFHALSPEQQAAYAVAVADGYRARYGLMSSGEIRAARESLGMSQMEFAGYLGVGSASVKRWESGQIQDKASDELMRLKTDVGYAERMIQRLKRKRAARPFGGEVRMFVWRQHEAWGWETPGSERTWHQN